MTTLNKIDELELRVARLEKGRGGKVFIDIRKERIRSSLQLGVFLGEHREELGIKRTRNKIVGEVFLKMEEDHFLKFDDDWDRYLVTGKEEVGRHISQGFAYHFFDDMHLYVNDPYFLSFPNGQKEEVYSDIKVHEEVEELLRNTQIRVRRLESDTGAKGYKITFS